MAQGRLEALVMFIRARFSPQGHMGLHLTVGILLMVAAAWLFGSIAEDVMTADEITIVDVQVAQWFHSHASPSLTRFMLFVTNIHGILGITVFSILFATFLAWKRDWYWLLTLVITVSGGMLLNVLLKNIFQRARPSFENPLVSLTTYSFPSGHASGSTLFYGVLAAYLVYRFPQWRWRILIVVCAVALVMLVGLTRIYLGAHYLSDVLAAIAESCAWLALCLTAAATLRRRNAAQLRPH
jgi:membrane-associated phospholipid phosphatase